MNGRPPRPTLFPNTTLSQPLTASGPGHARLFLWTGEPGYIPVWNTSCSESADPPPDYGFTACNAADGTTPPWSPDMTGHAIDRKSTRLNSSHANISYAVFCL